MNSKKSNSETDPYVTISENQGMPWRLIGLAVALVVALMFYRLATDGYEPLLQFFQPTTQALDFSSLADSKMSGAVERVVKAKPSAMLTDTKRSSVGELPVLGASDEFIRQQLFSLSAKSVFSEFFETDEIIRKLTAMLVNLSSGDMPTKLFAFMLPQDEFKVLQISEDRFRLAEENFQRYEILVDSFEQLDPQAMTDFYKLIQPLFLQAYVELGHDQSDFEEMVFSMFEQIKTIPRVEGQALELIRPSVYYQFADPNIERLSALQKQFIRMGPANVQRIQAKVLQMEQLLKPGNNPQLPASSLASSEY